MYTIKTMNAISGIIKEAMPEERYHIAMDAAPADAYLVRSADLHSTAFEDSLLAIGRAGAGTNNIPIDTCTSKGIVVFNTPGANANAVKELIIAALLLASRKIVDGIAWAQSLKGKGADVPLYVYLLASLLGRKSWERRWASWAWAPSAAWWQTAPPPWE